MKIKILAIALLNLMLTVNIFAEINGKVYGVDENLKSTALQNARIMALPSKTGTLTNSNGKFTIKNKAEDTVLIISYIG